MSCPPRSLEKRALAAALYVRRKSGCPWGIVDDMAQEAALAILEGRHPVGAAFCEFRREQKNAERFVTNAENFDKPLNMEELNGYDYIQDQDRPIARWILNGYDEDETASKCGVPVEEVCRVVDALTQAVNDDLP